MSKTVLFATAAALALTAGGIASAAGSHPVASSAGSHAKAHPFISASPSLVTLYDQNGNDGGTGVSSQNFETTYDAYDDQGADDFTVPAGHTWNIKEVDVTGVYYNGSGPARSENVFFYKDKGGLPGRLKAECDGVVGKDNGTGSFVIKFKDTCTVKLKEGTYWVSVQANMDFGVGGQWGWEVNSVQNQNLSAWQNYGPGNGFAVCPTWGTTEACIGFGPDFMFALKGKDNAG